MILYQCIIKYTLTCIQYKNVFILYFAVLKIIDVLAILCSTATTALPHNHNWLNGTTKELEKLASILKGNKLSYLFLGKGYASRHTHIQKLLTFSLYLCAVAIRWPLRLRQRRATRPLYECAPLCCQCSAVWAMWGPYVLGSTRRHKKKCSALTTNNSQTPYNLS